MALYDWNHDGKKDLVDDVIEYNIYKKCTENRNDDRQSSSNFSAKGFLAVFLVCCVTACFNELIATIIFGVYLLIMAMA